MEGKISLKSAGIIAGASAIFAFIFGLIISAGIPGLTHQPEASPEKITSVPLVNEEGESPFTKVVEMVSPAVVNISAERRVRTGIKDFEWEFRGPFEDFFRDFFKNFPRYEGKSQTLGSGFIISEDGYVVTNHHVIKDASEIIIRMTNKKEYKGKIVKIIGSDQRTDVALLKIETDEKFPCLKLGDSDKIKVGDWVIAVGNPFNLEGTVTVGVISAKGRSNIPLAEGPDFQSFLQTDAAINPGNSGGPLLNIHGEVIGINTAIASATGGNIGIGFAIPINLARTIIDELKTKGKVTRGYLGVYLGEVNEEIKDALGLSSTEGVLINEVVPNSPAERAGLKEKDVIIEFDGKKVTDVQSFRIMVASTKVGKEVKLKLFRDGKVIEKNVKIGEMPEESVAREDNEEKEEANLGLTVVELDDTRASRYNPSVKEGVMVIKVAPDTPGEEAGIQDGDVIIGIGEERIRNLSDYRRAVARLKKGKPIIFQIQRGDRKRYVAVTP
uniref:Probable periplasmic serine endoprotease DegP-like n=1 Tax=candidate division WOR-3 bacterium TaxID=2052148 RepID=A0A7C4XLW5_UNCW3